MTTRASLLAALLLGAAGGLASAQTEGPLAGTPAVVLVQPGTSGPGGPLASDIMHRKRAGFVPYAPNGPSPAVDAPVYTTEAMFGGGSPPPFEINAFSTGLDCVLAAPPVSGTSLTAVPPGAWGAILFSVTPSTIGEPGGLIDALDDAPDGAAADFLTLMVPGSFLPPTVDPCYPQDRPQLAIDAPDMGLFEPGAPGDVSSLDVYVPLYHAGPPITASLPPAPTVYFSVSRDAIDPPGGGPSLVPTVWFGGSAPSSATILKTTWIPVAGAWSVPVPHLTYVDLGLDLEDDVDALAVDELKCLLLFSIADTPASTLGEQLQIASWPKSDAADQGVATGIYVTAESGGTEPVAGRTRIGSQGDIDGTCTIDPSGEQPGGVAVHFAYGSPAMAVTNEKTLGAGLYRDEAVPGPTLTPTVHGVPDEPTSPLQRLELWVAFPVPMGPWLLLPAPIYLERLDGSVPLPHRTLPLVAPAVGAVLGAQVDMFWVIQGTFPRPSSPVLRIAL